MTSLILAAALMGQCANGRCSIAPAGYAYAPAGYAYPQYYRPQVTVAPSPYANVTPVPAVAPAPRVAPPAEDLKTYIDRKLAALPVCDCRRKASEPAVAFRFQ